MRFRKLRIAWSVACGIACVLLIVLWVRSYWWFDSAVGPISGTRFLVVSSGYGRLHARLDNRLNLSRDDGNWHFGHSSIAQFEKEDEEDLRRAGTRGPVIINRPARPIFGPRFDGFFVSHGFVVLF